MQPILTSLVLFAQTDPLQWLATALGKKIRLVSRNARSAWGGIVLALFGLAHVRAEAVAGPPPDSSGLVHALRLGIDYIANRNPEE